MEFSEFAQLQYLIKKQTDQNASEEIIDQTQIAGSINKNMIGSFGLSDSNVGGKFGQGGYGQSAQLNYTIDNNATYKQGLYRKESVISEEDSQNDSEDEDDYDNEDDSYDSNGVNDVYYKVAKRRNSLEDVSEEKEDTSEDQDRFANLSGSQDYRKDTGSRKVKESDKESLAKRSNSKNSGSSGGFPTSPTKKNKKNKKSKVGEDEDSKFATKVLTFVDMSQLSYLSHSQANPSHLNRRRWSASNRIAESDHEESDEDDDSSASKGDSKRLDNLSPVNPRLEKMNSLKVNNTSESLVKEFCVEILEDLINLISETQEDTRTGSIATDIVDNKTIMSSLKTLRKKPFIKEQVDDQFEMPNKDDPTPKRSSMKSMKRLLGSDTMKNKAATRLQFRKSVDVSGIGGAAALVNQLTNRKSGATTFVKKRRNGPIQASALTDLVDNLTGNEFVLQPPNPNAHDYLKTKIFFFEKSECIQIEISNQSKVKDVIRHILTLYNQNKALTNKFGSLKHEDADKYELRLIDDYESPYCPDYEMNALEIDEAVGEFESLAFVQSKKQTKINNQNKEMIEWEKALKEKGQRHIIVKCNTSLLTASVELFLKEDDKIETILEQVPKKFNRQKFDPGKYVLLPVEMPRYGEMQDVVDYFGGYNPFEGSKQLIDPQTTVRNIPGKTIELREKIFVDRPGTRQIDIPLEERSNNPYTYKDTNQFGQEMGFSVIDKFEVNGHNTFAQPNRMTTNLQKNSVKNIDKYAIEERKSEYRKEEDFLFGQISGSQLQQFRVIKFNRKDKPQPRILCIDGYNIYNKKVTEQDESAQGSASMTKKSSLFGSLLSKSIFSAKRKQRPISSIKDFYRITDTMLIISFQDKPSEPFKRLKYQTDNPETCSEILAKIRFLTTNSREKQSFMQQNQQMIIPNMMMSQTMGPAAMSNMQNTPASYY